MPCRQGEGHINGISGDLDHRGDHSIEGAIDVQHRLPRRSGGGVSVK